MGTAEQKGLMLGTKFEPIELELPWPPSINHYFMEYAMPPAAGLIRARIAKEGWGGFHVWLRKNTRVMKRVGQKGQEYRADVLEYVLQNRLNKGVLVPLTMRLVAYPPDRRERDLDNLYKPLLDSLECAKVFMNDSQVRHHDSLLGFDVVKGGKVVVTLEELVY